MNRMIVVAVALALSPAALAQLYKYVDKDGKTVYSDQAPANVESKQISVPHGPAPTAPAAAAGNKSALEKDKELEKTREAAREKQKKSAEEAKQAEAAEQKCRQLREAYQTYAEGGRIQKLNDKGERILLDDAQIEAERNRTRREMEEACKKS